MSFKTRKNKKEKEKNNIIFVLAMKNKLKQLNIFSPEGPFFI